MGCCGGHMSSAPVVPERAVPHGAKQTELQINSMRCGSCVAKVQQALANVGGVYRADVHVGSAVVRYDPNRVSEDELAQAIQHAGDRVGAGTEPVASGSCC